MDNNTIDQTNTQRIFDAISSGVERVIGEHGTMPWHFIVCDGQSIEALPLDPAEMTNPNYKKGAALALAELLQSEKSLTHYGFASEGWMGRAADDELQSHGHDGAFEIVVIMVESRDGAKITAIRRILRDDENRKVIGLSDHPINDGLAMDGMFCGLFTKNLSP